MTLLLAAMVAFAFPLGLIALVAAVAGFFFRPLQPLMLPATAGGVGCLCKGLAAGESLAPAMPGPLLLALLAAVCVSIA